ncbi:MAG: ROK family protein [Candidatus Ornithomonoglobus sp.]
MYIGIDLGGTNIAAGIVSEDGKILIQDSVPTLAGRDACDIVRDMAALSKKLIKDYGADISQIKGIGIGVPGTVDNKKGEVVFCPNINMLHFPLAEELRKHIELPVTLDNDANCAALGEYTVNGGNAAVYLMITLGTGVGSGLIINGRVFSGANGVAVEAGHMTLVHDGIKCGCGKRGCWEVYASVSGLKRQTKDAMEAHPESLMHKHLNSEGAVSGRTAFEAAKEGDEAGKAVVARYAEYIADGIVSMENIFQPDIIAIGGGISREGDYLLNPVKQFVKKNRFNKYMKKTKLVTAKLFNDAGIIGAGLIAKD